MKPFYLDHQLINWKQFRIKSNLNSINIPNKDTVKYLGTYLDNLLYFNNHLKEILQKARRAFSNTNPYFTQSMFSKESKS